MEDRVNTPATVVPGAIRASITSGRSWWRIAAAAVENSTPSITGRFGNSAGASGETETDFPMPIALDI